MRGRTLLGLLVTIATLCVAGCSAASAGQPPLEDTGWVLQEYGEPGDLKPVIDSRLPTLFFEAEGEVRGSAGCNTYFGSYTYSADGQLSIMEMGATEAYCEEEGVMEQEEAFLEALRLAEHYEIENDEIMRITGGGKLLVLLNNCLCND
ncbi:MAG: META domain-containing protein [Chloroflexota bacterium]